MCRDKALYVVLLCAFCGADSSCSKLRLEGCCRLHDTSSGLPRHCRVISGSLGAYARQALSAKCELCPTSGPA